MILRQRAVNKPPSEDWKMTGSHTGELRTRKPIHIQRGGAKGSIICFPCSQKVHVRWLSHGDLSITGSITGGALGERGGRRAGKSS